VVKIPRIACFVAFVTAAISFLGAVFGSIVTLPFALIPLFAGVGILRKHMWSAYGFALYLFAQSLTLAGLLIRAGDPRSTPDAIGSLGLTLFLGCLFLFAGRLLASVGPSRGIVWPWIMISLVSTVPLLFVQAFLIPSGAMEDTLLVGDRILVQRFPRPQIQRADMVAFVYPVDRNQKFVKRVIGIAATTSESPTKSFYRNGIPLKEPYALHRSGFEDSYRDNFPSEPNTSFAAGDKMLKKHVVNGEVVVPERSYFVLGDNRDNSLDSRYWVSSALKILSVSPC
jgi:signal peptidase I